MNAQKRYILYITLFATIFALIKYKFAFFRKVCLFYQREEIVELYRKGDYEFKNLSTKYSRLCNFHDDFSEVLSRGSLSDRMYELIEVKLAVNYSLPRNSIIRDEFKLK